MAENEIKSINGRKLQDEKARQDIANISVPTKTSELINDNNFLDGNEITKTTTLYEQRPLITFIDDDGGIGSYTHTFQIFKEKNKKFNCAVSINYIDDPTNGMSTEQIQEIIDAGNTISSHTLSHFDMGSTDDMSIIEKHCKESKEILESKFNITVDFLTLPWGALNNSSFEARKVMKKYYKGVISTTKGYNTKLNTYHIERQGLMNDLEKNKKLIDKVKENKGWLIFMSHGTQFSNETTGAEATQVLKDLIDYIDEVGIEIVTPEEGFEIKRNIIEISNDPEKTNGFTVSAEGVVNFKNSDKLKYIVESNNLFELTSTNIKNNTPITDFPIDHVVEMTLTQFDGVTDFPVSNTGNLITHRKRLVQFSYQEWRPLNSNYVFTRGCNTDGSFKDWVNLSLLENVGKLSSVSEAYNITSDTLPSDFTQGNITYSRISLGSAGFPMNSKGMLITNCLYDSLNIFQIWVPLNKDSYNKRHLYIRYSNYNGSAWEEWYDVIGKESQVSYDTPSNNIVASTLPSELTQGKVMYTVITLDNSTGFPENKAGLLTTNTISGSDVYSYYQEYVTRNEGKKYIRNCIDSSTWGSWKELTN